MRPYFTASSPLIKLSRSVSFSTWSNGLPVCLDMIWLRRSRIKKYLFGVDLNICRLALKSSERLMNHHSGMGRDRIAFRGSPASNNAPILAACPTHGAHIAAHKLHGVMVPTLALTEPPES